MNLILGTANFGNDYGKWIERDECFKILDRAKELGIWAVDTAQGYGDSPKIIQEWGGGLPVFSKHKKGQEFPEYADYVLAHDEFEAIGGASRYWGASFYTPELYKMSLIYSQFRWVQAPFNPLNLAFKEWAAEHWFIARSIFVGGKVYGNDADRKAIAKLTFGFLRSHEVKNVVFGVESIEDLEINVDAARDTRVYDTRYLDAK